MRSLSCSAPGKLVILGEYAVLFGHPAVVLAVNRRAHVDLRPATGDHWAVVAPGFEERPSGFELDHRRGFRWIDPGAEAAQRLALVEKVMGSLVESRLLPTTGLRPAVISLDTREFFQLTEGESAKLGLGSSAALTVALTTALRRWSAPDEGEIPMDLGALLDLHRSFQGGRGSGIDLAASATGGVVEYRLSEDGRRPEARSLEIPGGLHLVFLFTGRSASTSNFLQRLAEGMQTDGGAISAAISELGRVSADGIKRLRKGEIGLLLDDIDAFGAAMDRLGRAAGIPILSEEHREIRRLARSRGVSYKPSGAGGGDVGIGFTDDPERAVAFADQAFDAGFPSLDLEVDPDGVQSEFSVLSP